jgi:competence protein ComEA
MRKSLRLLAAGLVLALAFFASAGVASAASAKVPAGKVNLNTATVQQLAELPGVGGALAARIIEYRQKGGGFKSEKELMNVKGIGEKNFAKLEAHVTVGEASKSR